MTITTDHPASEGGLPVILDDDGNVLGYKAGVKAVRARLGLSQSEFAAALGVSVRTVHEREYGRNRPSARVLNLMASLLRATRANGVAPTDRP